MKDNAQGNQAFIQKFFRGGLWSLFIRAFAELSTLLISMIVARILAPDQVGIYFLVTSIVSVVVVFSLFGLNIAIVRIIASSAAIGKSGIIDSAIIKSRIAGLTSSFIVASLLYFVGLDLLSTHVFKSTAIYDLRLLIAMWVILWSVESLNAEIFRGFKQFHLAVIFARFAPNLIILLISGTVFITSMEIDLYGYLHIVLFGWLCSVALSSFILQKHFMSGDRKESMTYGSLFSTSIPLWFTGWISFSLPKLDLWILGAFESGEMLALYGAASRLILIIAMPLFIIQAVVPALIAESYAAGKMEDLTRGLQTAAAIAFYPGLFLCLVYFFYGDVILQLVFGDFYSEAFLVLKILTVGVLVRIFAASSQSLLNMTGHGKTSMTIAITSGCLMVIGCIYGGSNYGMQGIAVAAAATISLHNLLNFLFARFRVGIWVMPIVHVAQIRIMLAGGK